ncbi:MAG: 4-hydroxyphenylacetate 3-monooxygenase [Alphaproteobacteria bacterium]|nr:4-hydroxyphenylacetate 3-monooxygenase [Alphaproteobacteria bacterium]
MPKSGADHLNALRDGREVFLNGEIVKDVTTHPAFRNACRSAADLYDFQCRPENIEMMTFKSPTSGERVNKCWLIPKSHAEMVDRRKALVDWSRTNFGWLGRSPDHIASSLVGQLIGIEVFERHDKKRAQNFRDYFAYCRDKDIFLTYVIINPQADRSKTNADQQDEYLTCAVVDEDSHGITVRGAKMLGTSSIMANEVLVANIQPLAKGEEKYALSFALPMGHKGIKIMSRKSFEEHAVSEFDNPLATHYDENDALVYFDDVKVPWERVFIYKDIEAARGQFQDTAAHLMQNYQCQIRLLVKMQFLMGVARKIAETNGIIAFPPVRDTLGKLAAQAAMVEAMVHGMEAAGTMHGGAWVPHKHMMYAAQVLTQEIYPQFVTTIRELGGGGLIMLPSSAADFGNVELAQLIGKTQQSPTTDSEGRVKFMKLAWDSLGSEFASRHVQYEMFYAGAQFVTRAHSFRTYDWGNATGLVNECLGSYDLKDSIPRAGKKGKAA